MKSILIEKPNQLAIVEREIPTPSAGEVRVKVKLAGICGSDSHIYRGHNPFAKYPRVIGHEFFGVIDAVGEGVESARVGERVALVTSGRAGHTVCIKDKKTILSRYNFVKNIQKAIKITKMEV